MYIPAEHSGIKTIIGLKKDTCMFRISVNLVLYRLLNKGHTISVTNRCPARGFTVWSNKLHNKRPIYSDQLSILGIH